mgnify:CR=1 FL=1
MMDQTFDLLPGESFFAEIRSTSVLLSPIGELDPCPIHVRLTNYRLHCEPVGVVPSTVAATSSSVSTFSPHFVISPACLDTLASTAVTTLDAANQLRDVAAMAQTGTLPWKPINLPLMLIEGYEGKQEGRYFALQIVTKHVWNFTVGFRQESELKHMIKVLDTMSRPSCMKAMPAFELREAWQKSGGPGGSAAMDAGWNIYDDVAEWQRQLCHDPQRALPDGIGACWTASTNVAPECKVGGGDVAGIGATPSSPRAVGGTAVHSDPTTAAGNDSFGLPPTAPQAKPLITDTARFGMGHDLRPWFRVTDLGQSETNYGVSYTYPFRILVPAQISDRQVLKSMEFRSRGRVPAISYVHLGTGAVLARASQPLLSESDDKKYEDANLCFALAAEFLPHLTAPFRQSEDHASTAARRSAGSPAPAASLVPPPALSSGPPPLFHDDDDDFSPARAPGLASHSAAASGGGGAATLPGTTLATARPILIVDLRPKAAAAGNMAKGGGYETGSFYEPRCKIVFSGIDNIHGITAAFQKLKQLVAAFHGRNGRSDFYSTWEATQWPFHVSKVLQASMLIADCLEKGTSVLTHCTDGWDRTSQATALAMLVTDPYYRTVEGFIVLIEKEFCAFGHKFAERLGHQVAGRTVPKSTGGAHIKTVVPSDVDSAQALNEHKLQPSPIFTQWMDCVYQICRQFPSKFEFSPAFLEFVSLHAYSCWYGTFLANTHKERYFEGVRLGTMSLWTEVVRQVEKERTAETHGNVGGSAAHLGLLNPLYNRQEAALFLSRKLNCGFDRLRPCVNVKSIELWRSLYFKFDTDHLYIDRGSLNPIAATADQVRRRQPLLSAVMSVGAAPWWKDATRRRSEEAERLERLDRLVEQASASLSGSVAGAAASSVEGGVTTASPPTSIASQHGPRANLNAKTCWSCHEKFGVLRWSEPCAGCGHLHCAKCLPHFVKKKKLCMSCHAANLFF